MTYHKSSTEEAQGRSERCRAALHNLDIHDLDNKNCFATLQPRTHIHDLGEVDEEPDFVIFILP
jgi:hypothetical protein